MKAGEKQQAEMLKCDTISQMGETQKQQMNERNGRTKKTKEGTSSKTDGISEKSSRGTYESNAESKKSSGVGGGFMKILKMIGEQLQSVGREYFMVV